MEKRANQGLPEPGIAIGHVHLRVSDLDRAMAFYKSTLGLEVTHRTEGGVFLSAGGSHALIGLNTGWSPEGQAPAVGQFAVRYPDRPALARALSRVTSSGAQVDGGLDHGPFEALYLHDPDGHLIELYYDRSPAEAGDEAVAAARPLDLAALGRLAAEPSTPAPVSSPPISADLEDRLRDVRLRLLDLHKVLLDDTKAAYEMDRGRIPSNATLLQLVINDPWFAWLRPLSELVVRIDVALQPDGAATDADGTMLLDQVERLLSPPQSIEPFAQRYYEALQRQPAVITAHGDVRRVLKRPK